MEANRQCNHSERKSRWGKKIGNEAELVQHTSRSELRSKTGRVGCDKLINSDAEGLRRRLGELEFPTADVDSDVRHKREPQDLKVRVDHLKEQTFCREVAELVQYIQLFKDDDEMPGDEMPVDIIIGMSGMQTRMHICRTSSLESVLAEVLQVHGTSEKASVQLTANGATIASVEQLLDHQCARETIYATFFTGVDQMSLADVAEELACDDGEFKGHQLALQKLPHWSTPRTVADYFWKHQILLTSLQAESLFDMLFPKFASRSRARPDLIIAIHSFCVQQHHIWEPNDGISECLWANMNWGSQHLYFQLRRLTRGHMQHWERATAAERSSPDQWPNADVCNLRQVLKARRSNDAVPLEKMQFVHGYGSWQKL